MSAKKPSDPIEFAQAFTRGDDSILNRASSAERRLLESLLIINGVKAGINLVAPESTVFHIDLSALMGLPSEITSGGGTSAERSAMTDLLAGFATEGISGTAVAALGPLLEAAYDKGYQIGQGFRNGAYGADGTPNSGVTDTTNPFLVSSFDVASLAIFAGYLMEKGAGDQIASVLSAVGTIVEGASPEAVRVNVDT